mmetsp:Transcript_21548/g.48645  ORF Transcript_21548/g.48645 Transcript_21548/m.48645 type:complete len:452 (-) Transcript_21548:139-1494(-)
MAPGPARAVPGSELAEVASTHPGFHLAQQGTGRRSRPSRRPSAFRPSTIRCIGGLINTMLIVVALVLTFGPASISPAPAAFSASIGLLGAVALVGVTSRARARQRSVAREVFHLSLAQLMFAALVIVGEMHVRWRCSWVQLPATTCRTAVACAALHIAMDVALTTHTSSSTCTTSVRRFLQGSPSRFLVWFVALSVAVCETVVDAETGDGEASDQESNKLVYVSMCIWRRSTTYAYAVGFVNSLCLVAYFVAYWGAFRSSVPTARMRATALRSMWFVLSYLLFSATFVYSIWWKQTNPHLVDLARRLFVMQGFANGVLWAIFTGHFTRPCTGRRREHHEDVRLPEPCFAGLGNTVDPSELPHFDLPDVPDFLSDQLSGGTATPEAATQTNPTFSPPRLSKPTADPSLLFATATGSRGTGLAVSSGFTMPGGSVVSAASEVAGAPLLPAPGG